jgi:hypothetical protein
MVRWAENQSFDVYKLPEAHDESLASARIFSQGAARRRRCRRSPKQASRRSGPKSSSVDAAVADMIRVLCADSRSATCQW